MVRSQLEVIEQGLIYLNSVTPENYTAIIAPNFMSSAGSHMRHIIDHYQSIISGIDSGLIDYDVRERGGKVESSPSLAIEKLNQISHWINNLSEVKLQTLLMLATEVSVSSKNIQTLPTSVARELIFAGSHAVHHYAMISQISFAQNNIVTQAFGVAPATATYLRQNQPTVELNTLSIF